MELALYILMRNDLDSLNAGRAMAQASHASNAFIHKYGKRKDVQKWAKETPQGFGTAIVLSASYEDIQLIMCQTTSAKFPGDFVVDPEYGIILSREIFNMIPNNFRSKPPITKDDGKVVFFRRECTCAYIFGSKEKLFPYVGNLPLCP